MCQEFHKGKKVADFVALQGRAFKENFTEQMLHKVSLLKHDFAN